MLGGLGFVVALSRCTGMGIRDGSAPRHMSYSLNSLKGGYIGDYIGDYYKGY